MLKTAVMRVLFALKALDLRMEIKAAK